MENCYRPGGVSQEPIVGLRSRSMQYFKDLDMVPLRSRSGFGREAESILPRSGTSRPPTRTGVHHAPPPNPPPIASTNQRWTPSSTGPTPSENAASHRAAARAVSPHVHSTAISESSLKRLAPETQRPTSPCRRRPSRWQRGQDLNLRPSGYEPEGFIRKRRTGWVDST